MRVHSLLRPAALLSLTLGVAAGASAWAEADKSTAGSSSQTPDATANTLTDAEKAAGWRLLFDGKSMDQWRNYKKQNVSEKWQIKDGAMVLTGKGGGDIVTKEQFDAYELVLEYRISPGGNSGLMFHVQETDGPPYHTGPEVQIQDNVEGKDQQKSGWLYQLYPAATDPKTDKPVDATKPAGQWNEVRLLLDGPKGEIHMNGVKYASFELWSADWNERVAKSKFAKWEQFGKAKSGSICLQDHGDEVAFRNIKVRPIARK